MQIIFQVESFKTYVKEWMMIIHKKFCRGQTNIFSPNNEDFTHNLASKGNFLYKFESY